MGCSPGQLTSERPHKPMKVCNGSEWQSGHLANLFCFNQIKYWYQVKYFCKVFKILPASYSIICLENVTNVFFVARKLQKVQYFQSRTDPKRVTSVPGFVYPAIKSSGLSIQTPAFKPIQLGLAQSIQIVHQIKRGNSAKC